MVSRTLEIFHEGNSKNFHGRNSIFHVEKKNTEIGLWKLRKMIELEANQALRFTQILKFIVVHVL